MVLTSVTNILAIVIVCFNFVSIVLIVSILNRFSGELKKALNIFLITLFLLFVRGLMRLTDLVKPEQLEIVNLVMNFLITSSILGSSLYLFKMVKKIDGKSKK
ncbi:hypothetical protein HYT23_05745 [Candidatus Pacearchaeota archaeon]|nr:hypothetical protein [Candidatus Pacearchaeota archaeon]